VGLDGIQSRIDPDDPLDQNLYDLPPEGLSLMSPALAIRSSGAIAALENDHDFCLKAVSSNSDFIAKLAPVETKEYDALQLRPHPTSFRCTTTCERNSSIFSGRRRLALRRDPRASSLRNLYGGL